MLTTHIRTRGLRPGVKGFRVSIVQPKLQLQLVFPLWPKQFGARCIKTHKCRCCCKKKVAFSYIYTHVDIFPSVRCNLYIFSTLVAYLVPVFFFFTRGKEENFSFAASYVLPLFRIVMQKL